MHGCYLLSWLLYAKIYLPSTPLISTFIVFAVRLLGYYIPHELVGDRYRYLGMLNVYTENREIASFLPEPQGASLAAH
jgi:hypothetical protein